MCQGSALFYSIVESASSNAEITSVAETARPKSESNPIARSGSPSRKIACSSGVWPSSSTNGSMSQ